MLMTLFCPTCGDAHIEYGEVVIACRDPFHRTPSHSAADLEALLVEAAPQLDDVLRAKAEQVLADLEAWRGIMARINRPWEPTQQEASE